MFFAAIFLKAFDAGCKERGILSFRYNDDILCLARSQKELRKIQQYIQGVFRSRGLRLSESKSCFNWKIAFRIYLEIYRCPYHRSYRRHGELLSPDLTPRARYRLAKAHYAGILAKVKESGEMQQYIRRWVLWWFATTKKVTMGGEPLLDQLVRVGKRVEASLPWEAWVREVLQTLPH